MGVNIQVECLDGLRGSGGDIGPLIGRTCSGLWLGINSKFFASGILVSSSLSTFYVAGYECDFFVMVSIDGSSANSSVQASVNIGVVS